MSDQKKDAKPNNPQDTAAQLKISLTNVATLPKQADKTMEAKEKDKHSYK